MEERGRGRERGERKDQHTSHLSSHSPALTAALIHDGLFTPHGKRNVAAIINNCPSYINQEATIDGSQEESIE